MAKTKLNTISNCTLCGRNQWKEIFRTPKFKLLRCQNCQVVKTVSKFDDSQYDRSVERKPEFEDYARRFANLLPIKTGSLLDVGCGLGWFVDLANKIGFKAEGMDPGKGYPRIRKTWPNKKFDIITTNHVIEHIDNPKPFLNKIRSHLRPGGWVQITCPNFDSLMLWLFQERWYGLVPNQHRYQYSPKSLRYLLENNGFKVKKVVVNNLDYQVSGIKGIIFQCLLKIANITNTGDQVTVMATKSTTK